MHTTRVLPSLSVVEPHPLAAYGLRGILRRFRNATFHDALPSLPSGGALILVVDAGALAGAPGEFFRSVRRSNEHAKVIVLDAGAADDHLLELLFLGATGFVAYDRAPFDLVKAIRAVAGGSPWIPAEVLRQFDQRKELLASGLRRTLLTSKEETVYGLLERGMCNKEIASALSLSVSTVKFHLKNIFAKVGVHDRLRAVTELRRQRSPKPAPLAA